MSVQPFDLFCHERGYVERWQQAKQEEESRRSEAFLTIARPVAGVRLRMLTARDLFILDGFKSPFVAGDPATATAPHVVAVLWMLRSAPPAGFLGRVFGYGIHRRMLRRRWLTAGQFSRDHAELIVWFDAIFTDSGAPREKGQSAAAQPVGANFLASLLVPICAQMGAIDPATGQPLIESPLPALFQYQKILRVQREGDKFVDYSGADRIKAQALDDWNKLPAAEKAVWTERAKTYEPAA